MERSLYTYAAFAGSKRIAAGPIAEVALGVRNWLEGGGAPVLIFEDQSGQQIDLDLRGTEVEVIDRLKRHPWFQPQNGQDEKKFGPGRPKLGVVCREISLLPRHWEWLNDQPGGASVSLRKLVEVQMKQGAESARFREARAALSKFMWAMAGNLPDFEEASRALGRGEAERFDALIAAWPVDIRDHVRMLVERAGWTEVTPGSAGVTA